MVNEIYFQWPVCFRSLIREVSWFITIQRFAKVVYDEFLERRSSSVITQKSESQNGGNKKAKPVKFSEKNPNISYPEIRRHGVRNVRFFSENLVCFAFLLPPFWDSPFCLITDEFSFHLYYIKWDEWKYLLCRWNWNWFGQVFRDFIYLALFFTW